jgi:sigma-B regulation protein RsbU (phosphoserine phosphatase)
MELGVLERIQARLLEKRENLTEWLQAAPASKKQCQLGSADEEAVQMHLAVIDTALDKAAQHKLGLCQVCHDYVNPTLLEMDYTACVCLDHFSDEERRLLEAELELSQTVQKALLPQQIPVIPGLDLAVFSRPAQIVGGDYFDFFQYSDGAQGLAIADVAGHGLSTGMLMASVQTVLRTMAPICDSPTEILQRLNHFFYHNIHLTTFVTLFLARFDPASGSLTYSNAGHNPPLVVRPQANGSDPIWLSPTGSAIGLVETFHINAATVILAPGDLLLLYTDGVTEAINQREEQFGRERLADVIRHQDGLSARDLIQALRQALESHIAGQALADDITIIAGKMTG